MTSSSTEITAQSHDGRELELMLAERKPFAIFSEVITADEQAMGADDFAEAVRAGQIVEAMKEERWTEGKNIGGRLVLGTRQRFYATKAEKWRIAAYLQLIEAIEGKPWNETLEMFVCRLLGYSKEETGAWVNYVKEQYGGWGAVPVLLALTDYDAVEMEALGLRAVPVDFEGPALLILQGQPVDFRRICPEFQSKALAVARLALASKFWLNLKTEVVDGIKISRFEVSMIKEINRSLCRPIEMMGSV